MIEPEGDYPKVRIREGKLRIIDWPAGADHIEPAGRGPEPLHFVK